MATYNQIHIKTKINVQ